MLVHGVGLSDVPTRHEVVSIYHRMRDGEGGGEKRNVIRSAHYSHSWLFYSSTDRKKIEGKEKRESCWSSSR
jgi:hypothetical protein